MYTHLPLSIVRPLFLSVPVCPCAETDTAVLLPPLYVIPACRRAIGQQCYCGMELLDHRREPATPKALFGQCCRVFDATFDAITASILHHLQRTAVRLLVAGAPSDCR